MSRIFIAPYSMGSASAKALADALQCKRVDGSKIFKSTDIIINWGNSGVSSVRGNAAIINKIDSVRLATNKLATLTKLYGKCNILTFTSNPIHASQWIDAGHSVYARTKLDGHSGEGIIFLSKQNGMWVDAPLYTMAFPTNREYRVHVFNNNVIDIQQKRKRSGVETNNFIRNVSNGWVFTREDVRAPYSVYSESIKAINGLGLDFGAVDVLVDENNNTVVCEVNTSPGIENTTLDKYVSAINKLIERNVYVVDL